MGDIDEIRNLLARYYHHLDAGVESPQLSELFAENGEFFLLSESYVGPTPCEATRR